MTASASNVEQMVAAAEQAFGPENFPLAGYLRRAAGILASADRGRPGHQGTEQNRHH